jgi:hypothetical protein
MLNLAAEPKQGAEYSIRGPSSMLETQLASADSAYNLVYENITGAIFSPANTPMQLCALVSGISPLGQATLSLIAICTKFGPGGGTLSTLQPDPQAPSGVLSRVDIPYSMTALRGTFPSCAAKRGPSSPRGYMRALS